MAKPLLEVRRAILKIAPYWDENELTPATQIVNTYVKALGIQSNDNIFYNNYRMVRDLHALFNKTIANAKGFDPKYLKKALIGINDVINALTEALLDAAKLDDDFAPEVTIEHTKTMPYVTIRFRSEADKTAFFMKYS